jgi:transposase-like protein
MRSDDFPRSLTEFHDRFPNDEACAAYLVAKRWPDGFVCPACNGTKAWELTGRGWIRECAACHRQTSATAGTVIHGSKLSLRTWFLAAYLMASHSNGISALQLGRQLGLGSYKTAWLLCAKLRRALANRATGLLEGFVEVDETTLPQRSKYEPLGGGHGRSPEGKMLIVGAVEVEDTERGGTTPGRIRLQVIPDYRRQSLHAFVADHIAGGSIVATDDWRSYQGLPADRFTHRPHVIGKMAAHVVLPWVHRIFSLMKRWALGVYHGLRRKHLQRYLDEFVFRFDRRRSRQRAFDTLVGVAAVVQPATYREIVAKLDAPDALPLAAPATQP